jgi:hypothetical protein
LLLFFLLGIALFVYYLLIKAKKSELIYNFSIFFATCLLIMYYWQIISRGVAKPPTIEWEVERFLLLLMPFILVFAAYFIDRLSQLKHLKKHTYLVCSVVILLAIFLLAPTYYHTYAPQIQFESGLRLVTKDIGLYLKDAKIDGIDCIGNCPPIAYYSGKKLNLYYDLDSLKKSSQPYMIYFKPRSFNVTIIKTFCEQDNCVYLGKK